MRLLNIALMSALALLVVSGCVQTDGGSVDYHKRLTGSQLKPFTDAGCAEYSGYMDCQNASFVSEYGCFGGSLRIRNEGTGLEPAVPLLECRVEAFGRNMSESQPESYFYCGGGLLYACTSYIAPNDGGFIQVRNVTELASLVAPISSEAEAVNYVLLSENVIDTVERPVLGNLTASAIRNADGFIVTAYHYNPFGCYSKIDYEEVKFQVYADGRIREISRSVVYTKDLGAMLCVD